MIRPVLIAVVALAAIAAIQPARAQTVFGCPAGHALQAVQRNGSLVCIPVPAPVDLAPLQLEIMQETAERKAADAELAGGSGEASIVGTWNFTGFQSCVSSNAGFNENLLPLGPTSLSTAGASGYRTFNADHTGSVEIISIAIGGTASRSHFFGTFTWRLEGDKLVIEEATPATGTITHGSGAGLTVFSENVPPSVGVMGKDRRVITMTHDALQVEFGVTRPAVGPDIRTPRICQRERTLRKL